MARIAAGKFADVDAYFRAANYIVAAQLYLRDNVLLRRELRPDDLKDPALGHWGTAPGVNFIYAHLNRLLKTTEARVLMLVGPGHAAPAVIANLLLEDTLRHTYPALTRDERGLLTLVREFGQMDGLPTELSPRIPGCIHFGGELGNALAIAYGTVLDRPDLVTVCIVGDGEAETGPTAAAWHSCRYVNPNRSGFVLPILHLNGYRLSSPSLLGTLTTSALKSLFSGYGYETRFVGKSHSQMAGVLDWAFSRISEIRLEIAHDEAKARYARWPLIILRTPKGWTGPKEFAGHRIEGTYRSHKAPISGAKTNPVARQAVEDWLRSYNPEALFDELGRPRSPVLSSLPPLERRLGVVATDFCATKPPKLRLPRLRSYAAEFDTPGALLVRPAELLATMMTEVFRLNEGSRCFRLFSPDELPSNCFGEVLNQTGRSFASRRSDLDGSLDPNGRVMEVLSEHLTNGWMQGYRAAGGHGLLVSYECFIPVVSSAISQHLKFLTEAQTMRGRGEMYSLNYFLTSLGWHNNFSHQNPDLYTTLTAKYGSFVRIFFPPDANTLVSCMKACFESTARVNIVVAAKTLLPVWLTLPQAKQLVAAGVAIGEWLSASDPNLVFAACGDYATRECVNALLLCRRLFSNVRARLVFVCDLTCIGPRDQFTNALAEDQFANLFTKDKPVVFLFGGYPAVIRHLLFDRANPGRFVVHGYCDVGTTSTPVDLHIRNQCSRYDLVASAVSALCEQGLVEDAKRADVLKWCQEEIELVQRRIRLTRQDPEDL